MAQETILSHTGSCMGRQARLCQRVESASLSRLENYDPCFSKTSPAFFADTFSLR